METSDTSRWSEFGAHLRLLMVSKRLNRAILAQRAQVTVTTITRLTTGVSGTKYATLGKLVQALGLTEPEEIEEFYRKAGFAPPEAPGAAWMTESGQLYVLDPDGRPHLASPQQSAYIQQRLLQVQQALALEQQALAQDITASAQIAERLNHRLDNSELLALRAEVEQLQQRRQLRSYEKMRSEVDMLQARHNPRTQSR